MNSVKNWSIGSSNFVRGRKLQIELWMWKPQKQAVGPEMISVACFFLHSPFSLREKKVSAAKKCVVSRLWNFLIQPKTLNWSILPPCDYEVWRIKSCSMIMISIQEELSLQKKSLVYQMIEVRSTVKKSHWTGSTDKGTKMFLLCPFD